MEITSANQLVVESSDRQDEMPTGGSDAEIEQDADQFIMTSREAPIAENLMSVHDPNSMGDVEPVQTDSRIDPVVLGQLEEANPLDAFDVLANDILLSMSTGRSSNVSAEDPSHTSNDNLLVEFRSKVLRIDLFEAIEQDENVVLEIRELLCKLINLPSGLKFQNFLKVLEPLLDNIKQGFLKKKDGKAKLEEQTTRYDHLLDDITEFKAKLEAFRQETPVIQSQVAEIDSSIAQYRAKIEQLENHKTQLLAKEGLMKLKAQIAIKKIKESKSSQQEIAVLTDNGKVLEEKLGDLKQQLYELTSCFKM
ncbi:hypothetical protein MtrunA17_Chr4g0021821 [Medicago truncatula]|uniref:Uncharacterized protein n=1 Tax=Medicago truncatula TaxID=3880 RepID=A0A396I5Q5_MEDTR|nr:hypothetical protein MtrunA17_Chr4g0021821 [Medicago truncatula]